MDMSYTRKTNGAPPSPHRLILRKPMPSRKGESFAEAQNRGNWHASWRKIVARAHAFKEKSRQSRPVLLTLVASLCFLLGGPIYATSILTGNFSGGWGATEVKLPGVYESPVSYRTLTTDASLEGARTDKTKVLKVHEEGVRHGPAAALDSFGVVLPGFATFRGQNGHNLLLADPRLTLNGKKQELNAFSGKYRHVLVNESLSKEANETPQDQRFTFDYKLMNVPTQSEDGAERLSWSFPRTARHSRIENYHLRIGLPLYVRKESIEILARVAQYHEAEASEEEVSSSKYLTQLRKLEPELKEVEQDGPVRLFVLLEALDLKSYQAVDVVILWKSMHQK
jgi:hypothetical protein